MQNAPEYIQRLLDRYEAAKILRICVRSLDSHVKAGRLQVVRLGRRRLFRSKDLEAFIESLTAKESASETHLL